MKMDPAELRLYAVTDRAWTDGAEGVCRQVEAAIRGGATFVQVRDKHLEHDEFLDEAKKVVAICRAHGLLINDVRDGETFGPCSETSQRWLITAVKQYTQEEK